MGSLNYPSQFTQSTGGLWIHRRIDFVIVDFHGTCIFYNDFRRRGGDDEDIDAMIASLKKKTSGRDMYDVVRGIEQQQQ